MDREIIRIGKISSINEAKGTARVTYEDWGGSTTAEFSFLAWEYRMPKIGDQVCVAHLSSGSSSAVILGPVWHNDKRPIGGKVKEFRKELAAEQGKAYITYDADADRLTLFAGGCTLTMQSGVISVQGTITASGDVLASGVSGNSHTHACPHGGATSGPS